MALYNTLEEANLALEAVESKEDIINILKGINIDSEGTKTVLYSAMDDATINKLKSDSNVRLIDKTMAAKFLDYKTNDELKITLTKIFGQGDPNFKFDIEVENRNSALNKFLYNAEEGSAWNTVSKRFAEATTNSDIEFLVGENAKTDRVFFQTELDAVKNINDPSVTVKGQSLDDFKTSITDMSNEDVMNKFKTDTEARRLASLNSDGTLDTNKLTTLTQEDVKTAIIEDPVKASQLAEFDSNQYEKTQIAKATDMSYDEMFGKPKDQSDAIVKDFMQREDAHSVDIKNDINARKLDLYARSRLSKDYGQYYADIDTVSKEGRAKLNEYVATNSHSSEFKAAIKDIEDYKRNSLLGDMPKDAPALARGLKKLGLLGDIVGYIVYKTLCFTNGGVHIYKTVTNKQEQLDYWFYDNPKIGTPYHQENEKMYKYLLSNSLKKRNGKCLKPIQVKGKNYYTCKKEDIEAVYLNYCNSKYDSLPKDDPNYHRSCQNAEEIIKQYHLKNVIKVPKRKYGMYMSNFDKNYDSNLPILFIKVNKGKIYNIKTGKILAEYREYGFGGGWYVHLVSPYPFGVGCGDTRISKFQEEVIPNPYKNKNS